MPVAASAHVREEAPANTQHLDAPEQNAAAHPPTDTKSAATASPDQASVPAKRPLNSATEGPAAPSSSIDVNKTKPEDFEGEVCTTNELPSAETISKIGEYIVLDKDGRSRTFKSLYSGHNVARRVLVVFVRHFFCGVGRHAQDPPPPSLPGLLGT